MGAVDADGDQQVSLEEMRAQIRKDGNEGVQEHIERVFDEADSDKNGHLTLAELRGFKQQIGEESKAYNKGKAGGLMGAVDADGDQQVSLEEMRAQIRKDGNEGVQEHIERVFDEADSNKNGHLNLAELRGFKQRIGEESKAYNKGKAGGLMEAFDA